MVTPSDLFIPIQALFSWEIWTEIRGFDGYEISNMGRVRSYWKAGTNRKSDTSTLKSLRKSNGYLLVSLRTGPDRLKPCLVHRITLDTFSPEPFPGAECRHLDGVKDNNRLSNLRWGTKSENMGDRVVHGVSNRGERHGLSKLTGGAIIEIRARAAAGERTCRLAEEFGVSPPTISMIRHNRTWRHIK